MNEGSSLAGNSVPRLPGPQKAHVVARVPELLTDGQMNFDDGWLPEAICRDVEDKRVFFSPVNKKIQSKYYERAFNVCSECPVAAECLVEAMFQERWDPQHSIYGVRGGLIPRERVALARKYGIRTRRVELQIA